MHLPLSLLLDSTDTHSKGLIYPVFRVLHCVARGGINVAPWGPPPQHAGPQSGGPVDALWEAQESLHLAHLESLQLSQLGPADGASSVSPSESTEEEAPKSSRPLMRSPKLSSKDGLEMVRLAARTALAHLLNHLGQFPVTSAARLDAVVQEWQEVDLLGLDAPLSDLTPGLFDAPNLQFFIVNDCALMSLLSLPNDSERGFVEGPAVVRAIVRDVSGKSCWDARVLYAVDEEEKVEEPSRPREREEAHREGPEGAAEDGGTRVDQLREVRAET